VAEVGAEAVVGHVAVLQVGEGEGAGDRGGSVEVGEDVGLPGRAVGCAPSARNEPVVLCEVGD
jgi:hypothetical protein